MDLKLTGHPVAVPRRARSLPWLAAAGAVLVVICPVPPLAPRLRRPQRTLIALLALWFTWAVAYVLGFAGHAVVSAYDRAGSHLTTVADQEITVFLVWAVTGACFLPVVVIMGSPG